MIPIEAPLRQDLHICTKEARFPWSLSGGYRANCCYWQNVKATSHPPCGNLHPSPNAFLHCALQK
jgi:hypothetical protein